jgi:DnaJ-domain-containing protein 1
LSDIKNRTFGRSNKPLSELSDKELEEELLRRRRERADKRAGEKGRGDKGAVSPQEKQLAQYYANLELSPGASLEDVKSAYRELMRKYHPDKHLGDPARHKAATELAQSLTQAYQALLSHLGR